MKKTLVLLLIIILLIVSSSCTKDSEIEKVEDEIGVKPYTLSQENIELLKVLNLERTSNILSFKAPKAVKYIKANIYILEENGIWKEVDELSKEIKNEHLNNDNLEGTFSMIISDVDTKEMTIKIGSSISSILRDKGDYLIDSNTPEGDFVLTTFLAITFLEDFQKIELNKEIPVAIMVEKEGVNIKPYNIESFFDTTDFEEMDYVQAVTLTFSDEIKWKIRLRQTQLNNYWSTYSGLRTFSWE